jgi:hypothetical protein
VRRLIRVLDHEEIDVAVGPGIPASSTAEEDNAVRIDGLD